MASWQKEQKGPFPLSVAALPSLPLSQSYARAGVWLCSGHTHPYVHLFRRSYGKKEGPWSRHLCGLEKTGKDPVQPGAPSQGPLHLCQLAPGGQTSSRGWEEALPSRQSTASAQHGGRAVYSLLARYEYLPQAEGYPDRWTKPDVCTFSSCHTDTVHSYTVYLVGTSG